MAAVSFMFLLLLCGFNFFVYGDECDTSCGDRYTNPSPNCGDKNWDSFLRVCMNNEKNRCSYNQELIMRSQRRFQSLQLLTKVYCSDPEYPKEIGEKKCWSGLSSCLVSTSSLFPLDITKRDPSSTECQNGLDGLNACLIPISDACKPISERFVNEIKKHSCCGQDKAPDCYCGSRCNVGDSVSNITSCFLLITIAYLLLLMFK